MHNPLISEIHEKNYFDSSVKLNLNQVKFKFAFSVEGYVDNLIKDDPQYVKYIVRVYGKKDGKEYQKMIPYHKCSEKDWAQFMDAARAMDD